jgi:hypothetical protein
MHAFAHELRIPAIRGSSNKLHSLGSDGGIEGANVPQNDPIIALDHKRDRKAQKYPRRIRPASGFLFPVPGKPRVTILTNDNYCYLMFNLE